MIKKINKKENIQIDENLNKKEKLADKNNIAIKNNHGEFKFVALGGAQGVTMSCYAYGYKDEWIVVDCGILLDQSITTGRIVPDLTFLKDKKIKAFLLTHWHEDHLGAIPYHLSEFFSKCPIYASPMGTLKIKSTIIDELGENYKVKPNFITVKPEGETFKIGENFEVKFIHSTHLTPQSFMIAIKTPEGTVLHTGDWNFSTDPIVEERTDFDSLKALNKENFLAIVGDSTEVYRKNEGWNERDVRNALLDVFKKYKKKLFITLFSSSTARIESVYVDALSVGRKVCLVGRSIITNVGIAQATGFLKDCKFITMEEAQKLKDSEVCYLMTGCQGEPLAAMNKLVNSNIRGLSLNKDDAVVFSSSIIPGNQKDVLMLYGKIIDKEAELFTINDDDKIHSHGHGGYQDFVEFYKMCQPKALLPVHGDKLSQFLHMKMAKDHGIKNSFMFNNGDVIALNNGNPEIIEKVESGAIVVEGSRSLDINDQIFKNRKKAFYDGIVFATISIDKKGFLKDAPQVSSFGVFETDETGFTKKQIEINIVGAIKELGKCKQKSVDNISQAVSTGIRQALKNTGKKPKIIIHYVYK